MTAEEVRGFRISWMKGAEQEVEVILVREGKTKERERERETNPQRRQTVSHEKNEGIQTGSTRQEVKQKCEGQKRK